MENIHLDDSERSPLQESQKSQVQQPLMHALPKTRKCATGEQVTAWEQPLDASCSTVSSDHVEVDGWYIGDQDDLLGGPSLP